MKFPRLTHISDHAVLVEFGDKIDDGTHALVLSFDAALNKNKPFGVTESVPAFVNVLVVFDPLKTDHGLVSTYAKKLVQDLQPLSSTNRTHEVEVCYDPDFAPDLESVAMQCGSSADAVIAEHLSGTYRVAMYGFVPGYAYMSGVPNEIQVPRKPTPVRDVPSGSVIIAGPQCLVTTMVMPAGWWRIGRSPTKILLADPTRPFLFDAGDTVKFVRIDRKQYDALADKP